MVYAAVIPPIRLLHFFHIDLDLHKALAASSPGGAGAEIILVQSESTPKMNC
jgi:hypothetical protein